MKRVALGGSAVLSTALALAAACTGTVAITGSGAGGGTGPGPTASTSGPASASSGGATTVASSTVASSTAVSSTAAAGGSGGAASSSASSSSGVVDAGPPPPVNEIDFGQSDGLFSFTAMFNGLSACVTSPTGYPACSWTTCTPDGWMWGDYAGPLTIASGTMPTGTVVDNDTLGLYSYQDSNTWLVPGQEVSVSGAGSSMVPPFGPWSVTVPQPVTITSPAADGGTTTINSSSDFTVTWTGGPSGAMVTIGMAAEPFTSFSCTWDATLGQGTIPQALLATAKEFLGAGMIEMTYATSASGTFTAGAYTETVSASIGSELFADLE